MPTLHTRRQFLTTGLGMVSTLATAPAFLLSSTRTLAQTRSDLSSLPGVPDDRVLVVIQLSGGNDGLNTVIPFGQRAYHVARPQLAVRENDVIKLDEVNGIGLHPSLAPLRELIGEGQCAIQQGVGYPNPNRSHFASMDIWHAGDTMKHGGSRGVGWLGKALDASIDPREDDAGLACISLGNEAPMAVQGRKVKPVTFERAELFRWAGRDLHPDLSEAYDALHAAPPSRDEDAASFVYRTALGAQVASDKVRQAVSRDSRTPFPGSGLGRQLRMVANMIGAELPTRVYYVAMGGFDTHAGQANQHANLLTQFAEAVKAFHDELKATGHRRRVVTLAFSEFGRRVAQNSSAGTDHGCAGPVFVFGQHVKPGLLGEHPSLTHLDQGDLIHHTDFRSVYAALLENWMKMDATAALGRAFKPADLLRVV
jgi:uncharacterized protein (DUF1501 family)